MDGHTVIQTIAEVLIALLAVVGGTCIIRGVAELWLMPREITVAVVLQKPVDAATLDILLDDATHRSARRRGQRVVVLLPDTLSSAWLSPDVCYLLKRYNAAVYRVSEMGGTTAEDIPATAGTPAANDTPNTADTPDITEKPDTED